MSTLYLNLGSLPGGNDTSGNSKQDVTNLGYEHCVLPLGSKRKQGFLRDSKEIRVGKGKRQIRFLDTLSEKNY